MKNNTQKTTKRRFSLAFKLNLTSVLILILFAAGILLVSYQVQKKRIEEEFFTVADKAVTAMQEDSVDTLLELLVNYISSDEFSEVREKAVEQNKSWILANWMKEQEISFGEGESSYSLTLYDTYELMTSEITRLYQNFDITSAYYLYNKDGTLYYLVSPPNGLLGLGTPGPQIVYDSDDKTAGIIPAAIYRDGTQTTCRSVAFVHEYIYDSEKEQMVRIISENDDERLGIAVVDINMEYIVNASFSFLKNTLALTILLTAICIALNIFLVRRFAAKPLKELTSATCKFGKDQQGYSLENVIDVDIHSNDEINDLYQEIRAMQTRIVHYTDDLERLTSEKARAATEMQLAANIQGSMLKSSSTAFPGQNVFDIAASMDPAREVGGDFYDFFLVDEDHLALIIADVSGKGIPAALFMMSSMLLLKSHTDVDKTPDMILAEVNNEISKNNTAEMFVTVWMGILDLKTGLMKCANAGHEYPVLCGNDGKFKFYKDPHGLMIGAMSGLKYKEYELQLEPGNVLFVYTDGLPEAENAAKEFYGTDRIANTLNSGTSGNPSDVLRRIINDVDGFVAGAEQFDDLTMLCVRYNGERAKQQNSKE